MKKVFSLLMLTILFASCSQDIRFNDPALQGDVDGLVWRSTSREARIVNGELRITAMRGFETLEITVGSIAIDTEHRFGPEGNARAVFTINAPNNTTIYDTDLEGGDGIFIISEINTSQRYITAEIVFFDAPRVSGLPVYGNLFNFSRGIIHRIPLRN